MRIKDTEGSVKEAGNTCMGKENHKMGMCDSEIEFITFYDQCHDFMLCAFNTFQMKGS